VDTGQIWGIEGIPIHSRHHPSIPIDTHQIPHLHTIQLRTTLPSSKNCPDRHRHSGNDFSEYSWEPHEATINFCCSWQRVEERSFFRGGRVTLPVQDAIPTLANKRQTTGRRAWPRELEEPIRTSEVGHGKDQAIRSRRIDDLDAGTCGSNLLLVLVEPINLWFSYKSVSTIRLSWSAFRISPPVSDIGVSGFHMRAGL
jgi:hypothetical protein